MNGDLKRSPPPERGGLGKGLGGGIFLYPSLGLPVALGTRAITAATAGTVAATAGESFTGAEASHGAVGLQLGLLLRGQDLQDGQAVTRLLVLKSIPQVADLFLHRRDLLLAGLLLEPQELQLSPFAEKLILKRLDIL